MRQESRTNFIGPSELEGTLRIFAINEGLSKAYMVLKSGLAI